MASVYIFQESEHWQHRSIVQEMSPLTPFVLKSKIKLMENATRYGQIYDHLVKILARETHYNKSKDE